MPPQEEHEYHSLAWYVADIVVFCIRAGGYAMVAVSILLLAWELFHG